MQNILGSKMLKKPPVDVLKKLKGKVKWILWPQEKCKSEDTLSSQGSHHFWTKRLPHSAPGTWPWESLFQQVNTQELFWFCPHDLFKKPP